MSFENLQGIGGMKERKLEAYGTEGLWVSGQCATHRALALVQTQRSPCCAGRLRTAIGRGQRGWDGPATGRGLRTIQRPARLHCGA